ncbi:MAG: hypothetical protein JNG83_09125 [Opitutaceae bacterium]|nr:hypothetical protein [Opitutaceae bacterium]
MRVDSPQEQLLAKLAALRVELVDLAYQLDVQGRLEAADVAMATSARVAEICEEFSGGQSKVTVTGLKDGVAEVLKIEGR